MTKLALLAQKHRFWRVLHVLGEFFPLGRRLHQTGMEGSGFFGPFVLRGLFRVVLAACGRAEWMTMRKFSKHTPEQIVVKLEKAEALRGEGMSTAQACRVLGISEATLCRWR
mgnify:CR=1 FL=1